MYYENRLLNVTVCMFISQSEKVFKINENNTEIFNIFSINADC